MTDDTNEAAVYSLIEDWRQAVCLGDMPRVPAHHASDIVMFDVPERLQVTGLAACRRTWQLFFDQNPPGPQRFVLTELHVVVDQHVAFAHALLTICGSVCCPTLVAQPPPPAKPYWMTASARTSSDLAIVSPNAFAVLELITNSNFVGC